MRGWFWNMALSFGRCLNFSFLVFCFLVHTPHIYKAPCFVLFQERCADRNSGPHAGTNSVLGAIALRGCVY